MERFPGERRRPDFLPEDAPRNEWQRLEPSPSDVRFSDGRLNEQFLDRSRSISSHPNERPLRDFRIDPSQSLLGIDHPDSSPAASFVHDEALQSFSRRSDIEAELRSRNFPPNPSTTYPFEERMQLGMSDPNMHVSSYHQMASERRGVNESLHRRESAGEFSPFRNGGAASIDGNDARRSNDIRESSLDRRLLQRDDRFAEGPNGHSRSRFGDQLPLDVSSPATSSHHQSRSMGAELPHVISPSLAESLNLVHAQSNGPPFWRGTQANVWMDMFRSVLELEIAGLTPNQVETHQHPRIILEIVRYWFENLKHKPDQPLQDHLLQLDTDTCSRCFHLHPESASCFCPCWLKITILLTNDVDKIRECIDSKPNDDDRAREAEADRERIRLRDEENYRKEERLRLRDEDNYRKEEEVEREQLRLREKEDRLLKKENLLRKAESRLRAEEAERQKLREEEAEKERIRLQDEENNRKLRRQDEGNLRHEEVEREQLRLQDNIRHEEAERELFRLQEIIRHEEAERERLRLQENIRHEEAERGRLRLQDNIRHEEAERERLRLREENILRDEAEREGLRLREEEKIRLQAAERERQHPRHEQSERNSVHRRDDSDPRRSRADFPGDPEVLDENYRGSFENKRRDHRDVDPREAEPRLSEYEKILGGLILVQPAIVHPANHADHRSRSRSPLKSTAPEKHHLPPSAEDDAFSAKPVGAAYHSEDRYRIKVPTSQPTGFAANFNRGYESSAKPPNKELCSKSPNSSKTPKTPKTSGVAKSSCKEPFFVSLLKLDPTVDPIGVLESRSCHNCLSLIGNDELHEEADCPPDQRLCLTCFHSHPVSTPCSCDCQVVVLRETVDNLDLDAVEKWNLETRRAAFSTVSSEAPPSLAISTHPAPPFVDFLLKRPVPGVNIVHFVEKAVCTICLVSTHRMDLCKNKYLCAACLHEHHPLAEKECRCPCFKQRLIWRMKRGMLWSELEGIERKRRNKKTILNFLKKRDGPFVVGEEKSDEPFVVGEEKSDETGKKAKDGDNSDANHVIPKFVFNATREYKEVHANITRLVKPFKENFLQSKDMCLVCLIAGHDSRDCRNGFMCLNCFHNHEIGESCKCFCYLTTLSKETTLFGGFKQEAARIKVLLGMEVERKKLLTTFVFNVSEKETMKAFVFAKRRKSVSRQQKENDNIHVMNSLSAIAFTDETAQILDAAALITDSPSAVSADVGAESASANTAGASSAVTSSIETMVTSTASLEATAIINSSPETPIGESSTATACKSDSPKPSALDSLVQNAIQEREFKFLFVYYTCREVIFELTMQNKEPIASLKSELMTHLQQNSDPIPEGDMILYHAPEFNSDQGHGRLVDGKLISAYNFKDASVIVAVEFRDDVCRFQRDKKRYVTLTHPIPKFIKDFLSSASKKSLKATLDKNCLNCLAEKHRFSDCKEPFFCLSCFHPHKMQYACSCKCVLYNVAQVVDADRFDLKPLEKWNCKRVKRMAEIGRENGL